MTESPVYFAHSGGRQLGPLSFAELDALSVDGTLQPADLVWESGSPEWVPASTLLSFASSVRAAPPTHAVPGLDGPPVAAALLRKPLSSESLAVPASAGALPAPSDPRPPSRTGPPPIRAKTVAARFQAWREHLGSFSGSDLFPLPRLLDAETLGAPRSWTLLAFGILPLGLGVLVEDPLLRVRLFNLGCGALWTLFFVVAYRPEGGASTRLGTALFFASAFLGILVLTLLHGVPPMSWLDLLVAPERPLAVRLLGSIFGVGLLLEFGKAAVLVLFLRAFGGIRHRTEGVFYGLLTGLGFGVWAAVSDACQVSPRQSAVFALFSGPPTLGLSAYFVGSIVQMAALPFLHALWSAIVGYYIGLRSESDRGTQAPVALGILMAATLHGLYDFCRGSGREGLSLIVVALSALLFLAYWRSAEIVQADGAA